eukprot:1145802-Pelagomonas_calceolata.AAC.7
MNTSEPPGAFSSALPSKKLRHAPLSNTGTPEPLCSPSSAASPNGLTQAYLSPNLSREKSKGPCYGVGPFVSAMLWQEVLQEKQCCWHAALVMVVTHSTCDGGETQHL